MDNLNWYERHRYLNEIYNRPGLNLEAFPSTWETLESWFQFIDKNIPSEDLIMLLRRMGTADIMGRNKLKDYLAARQIIGKRDFQTLWCLAHPVKPSNSEPTTKEIIDIIYAQVIDKFNLLTLEESGQIMMQNSLHYSLNINALESEIIHLAEPYPKGTYKTYLENVTLKIQKFTAISQDDFYTDPWVISFQNGLYDITTKSFHDSDSAIVKNLKLFYAIPHDYKEGRYDCPKFKEALFKWFGNPFSEILMSDIFEGIGYCMTMNNGLKTAFMSHGPPDTGKTQLLNIIMGIIGKDNYSMVGLKRMTKNEFGTLWLQFKILNAAGETPKRKLYDTDVFKNATGGDLELFAEIKGGKQFKFPPYAKHWFNANKIPALEDPSDTAFLGRFILWAFRNKFEQKTLTRDYYKDILGDPEEIQGIIHYAIKGLNRLYKRNGFRKKLKENTRHVWLYESDDVYKFLYDYCVKDKFEKIPSEELWSEFNDVSEITLAKAKLTIELQKYNISKKQIRSPTPEKPNRRKEFYVGVNLKSNIEIKEIQEDEIKIKRNDLTDYSDPGMY